MTKILLVEDDKSLREIYGVRLLAEGYDIVSAGDGEEALAMAIKEKPGLIVSDVMMPKISGFDMLDILRSTTETRDIKVIMMTALSSEDQRQRGQQLGADRYLVKSQVGIEDVVRTVHEVLGDAPSAAPSNPQPVGVPPQARQMPVASAPDLQPAPQPTPAAGLPRPTAPFSSQRPANLGDRVIHPLDTDHPSRPAGDISSLITQELNQAPTSPSMPPSAPVLTSPPDTQQQMPQPQPQSQQMPQPQPAAPLVPPQMPTPVAMPQPTQPLTPPEPPRPPMPTMPQVPPREAPPMFTQGSDGRQ